MEQEGGRAPVRDNCKPTLVVSGLCIGLHTAIESSINRHRKGRMLQTIHKKAV